MSSASWRIEFLCAAQGSVFCVLKAGATVEACY